MAKDTAVKTSQKTSQKYYPTIGIEVHAELRTDSKMFCACQNNPFEAQPNTHICPICMAHPGTLPVPNRAAIDHMVRIGLAVDGEIANFTEFDRKNYFYPDIPKGYQISQYQYPIVSGGSLGGVALERIHLEEDTGTSKHLGQKTLIDFNRAGVPLMELVTKPVMHTSQEAMQFGQTLQMLLRYLGASHAHMERGEMRVEANISISPDPDVMAENYVEIKNINSFSNMGKAVEYEIARMTARWESGKQDEIIKETRGWDDTKQETYSQRKKENAADYRYFPEPDIPKMYLHELYDLDQIKKELPELPWERHTRYRDVLGLREEIIDVLIMDMDLATVFENTIIPYDEGDKDKIALSANYLTSDLVGLMKNEPEGREFLTALDPDHMSRLITMTYEGLLNSRGAKDVLLKMLREGGGPDMIAQANGLLQQNDDEALQILAEEIIEKYPDEAQSVRDGKVQLVKFLVGQAMKESKGSANPQKMEEIFIKTLQ